jgi:signal transduction histidine kinase
MGGDGRDTRKDAALDAGAAVESALEALAEMARALAHDLNQPLAAASNYLAVARQVARKQAPDAPALAESLEKAAMQITRATEAVRRMRVSMAPDDPNLTEQRLHDLIQRASASPENGTVKFDLRLDAANDAVLADADQLGSALVHLLGAAIEAAGGGQDGVATIATSSNGHRIQAEIAVSGPGSTTQPKAGRSAAKAIEWALSQRILKAHHGRLQREVVPAGPVVRFILPLAVAESHDD